MKKTKSGKPGSKLMSKKTADKNFKQDPKKIKHN
jgi:hypothetical protein